MHIFDKDIACLFLSNVGDPILDGHNYTGQFLNPYLGLYNIVFYYFSLSNVNYLLLPKGLKFDGKIQRRLVIY